MSRVTLYSLLLGLMLATGIRLWSDTHPDDCSRFPASDSLRPRSILVPSGSRMVEVPCNDWPERQTLQVQILCLVDVVLAVIFLLNALADLRDWWQRRRRWRQAG